MNETQQTKRQVAIQPADKVDNAAFTSNVIDLTDFPGADYIEFVGIIGSIDADMATLKLVESDTKTDATTLGGSPSDVQVASTTPGSSDAGKMFVIGVDLKKTRQQFLQLQATAGDGAAGTHLTAIAVGRRINVASSQAGDRNLLFADYV